MKCEKLDVWKLSARLSADVYKALSDCRDFGFKDQITRSGLSIPSNIAEGMEKESAKRTGEIYRGSKRFYRRVCNPDIYWHGYRLY